MKWINKFIAYKKIQKHMFCKRKFNNWLNQAKTKMLNYKTWFSKKLLWIFIKSSNTNSQSQQFNDSISCAFLEHFRKHLEVSVCFCKSLHGLNSILKNVLKSRCKSSRRNVLKSRCKQTNFWTEQFKIVMFIQLKFNFFLFAFGKEF